MSAIALIRVAADAYVACSLPDDGADEWTQRVAALRVQAALSGACPECSAVLQLPSRAAKRAAKRGGQLAAARMVHENTCMAGDVSVTAATGVPR